MFNIGQQINHEIFGIGKVVEIEKRTDGRPIIYVEFINFDGIRRFTDYSLEEHLKK